MQLCICCHAGFETAGISGTKALLNARDVTCADNPVCKDQMGMRDLNGLGTVSC